MAEANLPLLKVCTKCGLAKQASSEHFKVEKRVRCGLTAQCRSCLYLVTRQSTPAWYAKTKPARLEWGLEYRKTPAFRERQRARDQKYRAENYEKIKARVDRWGKDNPERLKALNATRERTRRARKRNAQGTHTADDIIALRLSQGECFYCEATLGDRFHVDHFVPLARGGSNDPLNLVLACQTCNQRKHARLPWVWMPERFSPPAQEI
jgi:5-methylcytosine-specific restriction endonuclease McrA